MRSSDRVLADIGVMRADIPLIAKGTDPHRRQPPAGPVRRLWRGMRSHLDAARRTRRERRRIHDELMAYSDRELDEVGIRRVDIPEIAREEQTLRRAAA